MRTHTLALPHFPTFRPSESRRRFLRPRGTESTSTSRLEKRCRRAASKGRPILLGSLDQPYIPSTLGEAVLGALKPFEGLLIRITTGSPAILDELALLVELDQRHAVTIDFLIEDLDPDSPALCRGLRAVAGLAADGLTTRVVIPEVERDPAPEDPLRRLLAAARDHGAFDVASPSRRGHGTWRSFFDHLRWEHGFPCPLPGRG